MTADAVRAALCERNSSLCGHYAARGRLTTVPGKPNIEIEEVSLLTLSVLRK